MPEAIFQEDTTHMTPTDKLHAFMTVFRILEASPGQALSIRYFSSYAQNHHITFGDLADGIMDARRRGWVTEDAGGNYALTEAGFAALHARAV